MAPPKSNTRILVVEDDATVRYTFSSVLEREGYDVSTANDGFDALLHLQREVPDVILSDSTCRKCRDSSCCPWYVAGSQTLWLWRLAARIPPVQSLKES